MKETWKTWKWTEHNKYMKRVELLSVDVKEPLPLGGYVGPEHITVSQQLKTG